MEQKTLLTKSPAPAPPDGKAKRGPKRNAVVVDTITTRFLMLFIIVLVIPLFSLIIFTQSLLEREIQGSSSNALTLSQHTLSARLENTRKAYFRILNGFLKTNSSAVLASQCPKSQREVCLDLNFDTRQVTFADNSTLSLKNFLGIHPDFEALALDSHQEQISTFSLWDNQLHLFCFRRISANHWITIGIPIDVHFLRAMTKDTPALHTSVWVIREPFYPKSVQWLSQVSGYGGILSDGATQEVLNSGFSNGVDTQVLLKAGGQRFRMLQHLLYNASNQPIARVVHVLSLAEEQNLFATYYLGIYIIMVAGLLFSVVVAILASRSITRPMLTLIAQVKGLTQSKNLAERVTTAGVHEINELGDAFNDLMDELEGEHRIKNEFVATLTHDLKVPLLAEKQTLEHLNRGIYGTINEVQKEVVETLRSANRANLDLVNGLLEVYRYESDRIKLMFETVDMAKMLDETVAEFKPLAADKHIELMVINPTKSTGNCVAWADRLEIRRVLINLLSNALTNTPKHGRVLCVVHDEASWGKPFVTRVSGLQYTSLDESKPIAGSLLISIQDSGLGFGTDDLPHLFKQFAANRGRNPMSIGLGLYNCYQVVNAHNGTLWVETTEGEGSAVSFLLPQSDPLLEEKEPSLYERLQPFQN